MGVFSHATCAGRVKSIQNYHMDTQGWADIAYNFLVCPHGYVFEGRGVGKRSAANGDTPSNSASYAICYLSGEGDAFTDEAKTAINEVALLLVPAGPLWKRHRDWVATACPGNEISSWVAAGHPAPAVPAPPVPAPPKPEEAPMAVRYSLPNGQIHVTDGLSRRYVGSPDDNDVLNDIGCKMVTVNPADLAAFHAGLHSLDVVPQVVDISAIVQGVLAGLNIKIDASSVGAAVAAELAKRLAS